MGRGISELDVVTLRRDLPEANLHAGDHGTVVHEYNGAYEVEFLSAAGRHIALLTLDADDVRLT